MSKFIEADPGCSIKIEFSDNVGKISGKLGCPIIDKSDKKNPRSICAVAYLKSQGYRVNIIKGQCPRGIRTRGSDLDAIMN